MKINQSENKSTSGRNKGDENEFEVLEEDILDMQNEINALENGFKKIKSLISNHRDKAPSNDELLDTIIEITDHYYYETSRTEFRPATWKTDWIDWGDL